MTANEMWTHVLSIENFYAEYRKRIMNKFVLSAAETDVLMFLANNPGYDTARDISELRGLSKSQVSQAVELLAAEGFLLRTPDEADRRVVHLSITPAGLPLARECQTIQTACGQRLLAGLSEEQEQQLALLLGTVLNNGAHLTEEESI